MLKMIKYLLNVENFIINEALFVQSLNEYSDKKSIVYWAQKFDIWSLFILICFKIELIVCNILNIAVT